MIEESDVEEAIRSLHAEFFAEPDPTVFDVEARWSRRRLRRASLGMTSSLLKKSERVCAWLRAGAIDWPEVTT